MSCAATIEDYANGTSYNLSRVIAAPVSRRCARAATCKLGHLHLCTQHGKLAAEGLVDEHGNVATRADLRAVRDNPRRHPDGLYDWAKDLALEKIR
jgi:hypothetical protein